MHYRILALDVDGTLLDPFGKLSEGVIGAVQAARLRGLRVVLCTGRRFRSALPVAQALGLEGEIVVHNGVLVKDIASGRTLEARYMAPELAREVIELVRGVGCPMVYVDRYPKPTDLLTERLGECHPFQREYLNDASAYTREVGDVTQELADDVVMVSTMREDEALSGLRERALARLGERVVAHSLINKNYSGYIQEFLPAGTGKWAALTRLAAAQGVSPREIVAIGDDLNDVEMIRGAGLGIAMGNAVRAAQAAADLVVRSNAEGGVIEAIERVILKLG
jgi:Cof subfamily protein (haloacid dehalogenase superfamily)